MPHGTFAGHRRGRRRRCPLSSGGQNELFLTPCPPLPGTRASQAFPEMRNGEGWRTWALPTTEFTSPCPGILQSKAVPTVPPAAWQGLRGGALSLLSNLRAGACYLPVTGELGAPHTRPGASRSLSATPLPLSPPCHLPLSNALLQCRMSQKIVFKYLNEAQPDRCLHWKLLNPHPHSPIISLALYFPTTLTACCQPSPSPRCITSILPTRSRQKGSPQGRDLALSVVCFIEKPSTYIAMEA